MTQKKETAETVSLKKRSSQAPQVAGSESESLFPCKVEFFADGVALVAPHVGNRTGKGAPPRGKIKGWSKSSRRRMREFLLTHPIKSGFDCYSVTYTIPGPVLSPSDAKRLFHNWQMSLNRAGGCAVWRLEVQQRGALHWHITAGLPSDCRPIDLAGDYRHEDVARFIAWSQQVGSDVAMEAAASGLWPNACLLSELWFRALDTLGGIERPIKSRPDWVETLASRSDWIGAKQHAAEVKPLPDVFGSWKRYLQDHNTKSKQEQIADGFGRHWGVICRKHFEQVLPDTVADLTLCQYSAFLRAYQRMCTPQRIAPWSVFGRCLGHTSRRGRSGRSVYFSNPATVKRLVLWASERPEPAPRQYHLKPLPVSEVGQTSPCMRGQAVKASAADLELLENIELLRQSLERTKATRQDIPRI